MTRTICDECGREYQPDEILVGACYRLRVLIYGVDPGAFKCYDLCHSCTVRMFHRECPPDYDSEWPDKVDGGGKGPFIWRG